MQHQLLKFTAEEFTHKKGLDFFRILVAQGIVEAIELIKVKGED